MTPLVRWMCNFLYSLWRPLPHKTRVLPCRERVRSARYKQVHQEKIGAEPVSFEHTQHRDVGNIVYVPIPQIQQQFVESVPRIPQERLLFERIEEQIRDTLAPPVVEETVDVDQKILLESIQQRTMVQTDVAPALQVYAPFPDFAVSDTGSDNSSSWSTGRCELCEVVRIADRDYAGRIRVIHAGENSSDWRLGSDSSGPMRNVRVFTLEPTDDESILTTSSDVMFCESILENLETS